METNNENKENINLEQNQESNPGIGEIPESIPELMPVYIKPQGTDQQSPLRGQGRFFSLLFIPSLLYALVFAFCTYDNVKGILLALVAVATVIYCRYAEKKEGITPKRDKFWYEFLLVLLGISCGLTDNDWIIFFNIAGMCVTLFAMLLHDFYDDRDWTIPKYVAQFFTMAEGIIGGVFAFFYDIAASRREGRSSENKTGLYVLLGLLIAAPLVVFIIMLLSSADHVFYLMIRRVFRFSFSACVVILFLFAIGFFASYACLRAFLNRPKEVQLKEVKGFNPVIAITVLSVISVIYLVFSVIQIVYLFIGNMTLPDHYTYAEYAREGFFQLLVVCLLNLLLVLFTLALFQERPALKGLLCLISGCTYIMIASSTLRMVMYIDVYYLTRKRVLVLWGLALIAILLVGVFIRIFRKSFPLLRYGMVVCALCYLVLSFGRMDYLIAKYNTEMIMPDAAVSIDFLNATALSADAAQSLSYLSALSADAAPAILEYDTPDQPVFTEIRIPVGADSSSLLAAATKKGSNWLDLYKRNIKDVKKDSYRQWNLSRFTAKKLLEAEK